MCGISGVLKQSGKVDDHCVGRMVNLLAHRGPDETGFYTDTRVALGHARLSIIDLAGGWQPMSNREGSLWITFNGEIFNYPELREELVRKGHRFATRSDTEVILHCYEEEGENCVTRFNGQWAFAIWDVRQQKLFLSRDRLGVRPLFYTQTKDSFIFASEIKALFACPEVKRQLDLEGLDQIFTFWVTLPPRTAFKNIFQLPPGHSLTVQDGAIRIHRYWKPEYAPEWEDAPAYTRRKTDELLDLLLDATRIRLRSDVPVAAYLSGGIDSTLITALITRLAKDRLKTFSVAFEDPEYDESSYQREASAYLGTQHQEVLCCDRDIGNVFPDVIWHCEQPVLRTAPGPLYLLSGLVRKSGFKVVLTGEGSDEILGGYDIYKEAKIRRFWGARPDSSLRSLLLRRLYPYMQNIQHQPDAYRQTFFHVTAGELENPFFSHLPRWQLTAQLKRFFSDAVQSQLQQYDGKTELERGLPAEFGAWPHFCQAQYLETMYLLPGYILSSQGDRMAMAHSVEGRYPFLDHRVVEFASKLSPTLKMKVLNEKYLLKQAASGLVPPAILRRRKQPYRAPEGRSILGERPQE